MALYSDGPGFDSPRVHSKAATSGHGLSTRNHNIKRSLNQVLHYSLDRLSRPLNCFNGFRSISSPPATRYYTALPIILQPDSDVTRPGSMAMTEATVAGVRAAWSRRIVRAVVFARHAIPRFFAVSATIADHRVSAFFWMGRDKLHYLVCAQLPHTLRDITSVKESRPFTSRACQH